MAEETRITSVAADDRLVTTPRRKSTLIVPELVLSALDQQIAEMEALGKGRIPRGDVVAALLVLESGTSADLAERVEVYRRITAAEHAHRIRRLSVPRGTSNNLIPIPDRRAAGRPAGS